MENPVNEEKSTEMPVTPETPETPAVEPETPAEPETVSVQPEAPAAPEKKEISWTGIIIALVAAALVITAVLSGALQLDWRFAKKTAEPTAAPTAAAEPAEEGPSVTEQLQAAYAKHDPDDLVMTVNGVEITWDVYYTLLANGLQQVAYYMGGLPTDYSVPMTEELTMGQYLDATVAELLKQYAVVDTKLTELGLSFTEEEEKLIADSRASIVESLGGEEAFQQALIEACMTERAYDFMSHSNASGSAILRATYGLGGEDLTEEDVAAWAADHQYIRAKHILYSFTADDGTAMDDEAKQAQRDAAAAALKELEAIAGDPTALETRLDELVQTDSGDPGTSSEGQFAGGYTFTTGEMTEAFELAAFALEENSLSQVVETDFGCHIILRLPVDPEGLTMQQDSSTGAYRSLRQMAANALFSADLAAWMDEAQVVWDPAFESFTVGDLFTEE